MPFDSKLYRKKDDPIAMSIARIKRSQGTENINEMYD